VCKEKRGQEIFVILHKKEQGEKESGGSKKDREKSPDSPVHRETLPRGEEAFLVPQRKMEEVPGGKLFKRLNAGQSDAAFCKEPANTASRSVENNQEETLNKSKRGRVFNIIFKTGVNNAGAMTGKEEMTQRRQTKLKS